MGRVINHAIDMHKTTLNQHSCNIKEKGMRIEFENDLTIQMEIDFGRIKIINRPNVYEILTRYLISLLRNYKNTTKGGIKTHT